MIAFLTKNRITKESVFILAVCFLLCSSCNQKQTNPFNINAEPLSTKAELKASTWNGYNDFVFELKDLVDNFSKQKAIEKSGLLVSKSQAILYSMPNDLRNEITNEKATDLVESVKLLHDSVATKTEAEITDGLTAVIKAYTVLNKEINHYTEN